MSDIAKTLINHRARATLILESDQEPGDLIQFIKRPDQKAFTEEELAEEKMVAVVESLHTISHVFNLDFNKLVDAITGKTEKPAETPVTQPKPEPVKEALKAEAQPIEKDELAFEEELDINAPWQIEEVKPAPAVQAVSPEEVSELTQKVAKHLGNRKAIGNILKNTYGVKKLSELTDEQRVSFKKDMEELLSAG